MSIVSGDWRCTSLLAQLRLSRRGEIPTGSHPEWNGGVWVKRQTRPRSRVGIQILAKYPAVISRRRKSVFRRWRLLNESGIASESWVTLNLLTRCVFFCAPIIRRTNSRVEHCRQWLIWLKTSELTIFTFHRSCIKIYSIGLSFGVTSAVTSHCAIGLSLLPPCSCIKSGFRGNLHDN